ncbi:hypothetical protein WI75_13900 [Burkholderia ubonensis]|nr:hypothetical protein WI75_13900 [Burkholderia ubonensis]KVG76096.1 hypothetical protein WJ34_05530 [Burkholderia ubonensis]KVH21412.1 hypothetical protein WJ37_15765 [Burkholderia ubonensis]KVH47635.1 hypothetical protein WJ38_18545 [Burkholderia ubonensis]KVH83003.1 hypothetical protein WJ43_21285 [Burkholderia ubonensis]
MSESIFGTMANHHVTLNTATIVGLRSAYEDFEKSGQDINNFEIAISERKASNGEGVDGKDVIGVTFLAKLIPGQRGLGSANRLGKSISYAISPESGKILGAYGTK